MKIVISSGQVRRDLGRRRVAVGGGEALGQRARLQVVLLRAGGLQGMHRHQVAEMVGAPRCSILAPDEPRVVILTPTRASISALPQPDLRSIRASSYSLPNR